jgi:galactokinase
LINTKVKHALVDSDYNQRAFQCEQAVMLIQNVYPEVSALRDVTGEMLLESGLPEVLLKRASFVIEENTRVHEMVEELQHHQAKRAGQLLKASHSGLKDKYEVSCAELDHLADFANQYPGVYGARMMGGCFGGCVICLLDDAVLDDFSAAVTSSYNHYFGFDPDIILFDLGGGVTSIPG